MTLCERTDYTHAELLAAIQLAHSRHDTRLWRANAGRAWQGEPIERSPGRLVLKHPRAVQLAPPGFPDLFGLRSVKITPELIGRTLPVFVAMEVKTGTGRTNEAQDLFLDLLRSLHAFHGVARSVEDSTTILTISGVYP
jgi:hypothetical protein